MFPPAQKGNGREAVQINSLLSLAAAAGAVFLAARLSPSGAALSEAAGAGGPPPLYRELPENIPAEAPSAGRESPERGRAAQKASFQELRGLALKLLRESQAEKQRKRLNEARLSLQKLFYQKLFFPAARPLRALGAPPPSAAPLIWHLSAFLFGVFSLIVLARLIFSGRASSAAPLEDKIKYRLAAVWGAGLLALAAGGFFALQTRASAAKQTKILTAPFAEALPLREFPAGAELLVLRMLQDKNSSWLKVKARADGERAIIGWTPKEDLFITLKH